MGLSEPYDAKSLKVFIDSAEVIASVDPEMLKLRDEASARLIFETNRLCDQAMRQWADAAGVSVETLVAAGIHPVVERVWSNDGTRVTINVKSDPEVFPVRMLRETEAEFIERARRMPTLPAGDRGKNQTPHQLMPAGAPGRCGSGGYHG